MPGRSGVDRTDSYAVLGLGDVAAARKEAAAERYYQQALRLDRGNNWRCAARPTSIAPNRRRKPAPGSPASLPLSGAVSMILSAA
ncbi:hypothetical protein IE978_09840 [Klebsiella pneumoniae]|uniref:Cellulose synthase operon protein C n=1 Tax=Klebsiella pneumoniae TaxID=573 RepID=A0A927DZE3_KLEPN|nr:hypothetical protein [Klebsiella pneumoniae]